MCLYKRPHKYSAFVIFSHVACNSIELQENKRLSLNVIKESICGCFMHPLHKECRNKQGTCPQQNKTQMLHSLCCQPCLQ